MTTIPTHTGRALRLQGQSRESSPSTDMYEYVVVSKTVVGEERGWGGGRVGERMEGGREADRREGFCETPSWPRVK